MLILSNIPCNAGDDCCGDRDEITTTTTSGKTNPDSDHKPVSPCAPFLACASYHGVPIPDIYIKFPKGTAFATKLIFFYKDQPLLHYSASIWQPPKTC